MGSAHTAPAGRLEVGRIGRPHGIRGEVTVTPFTEAPEIRFAPGSVLETEPVSRGPLTVAGQRRSGPVLVVAFEGIPDRNAAETFRGTVLTVDAESLPETGEDEFYDSQLIGLAVRDRAGVPLGVVSGVLHLPAHPVLEVERPDGSQELVPFVKAIVPDVDLAGGTLVVEPPDGMFG